MGLAYTGVFIEYIRTLYSRLFLMENSDVVQYGINAIGKSSLKPHTH